MTEFLTMMILGATFIASVAVTILLVKGLIEDKTEGRDLLLEQIKMELEERRREK